MGKSEIDADNRALCKLMRDQDYSLQDIADKVVKVDGITHPSKQAVIKILKSWGQPPKGAGGRPRKTTAAVDKQIVRTVKKLRFKRYVDARIVWQTLPHKLKHGDSAISVKLVGNRIRAAGGSWEEKGTLSEQTPKNAKKRVAWCREHRATTSVQWLHKVQAVADFKDFTWYPPLMLKKVQKYRSRYTYLWPGEKSKPGLTIPKKWFLKRDYKKAKKVKVFGAVFSAGRSWSTAVELPFTSEKFCKMVSSKLSPALKRAFPGRATFTILVDNETLMHTPEAKATLKRCNIKVLPRWPANSPDLNPQENVWPGVA